MSESSLTGFKLEGVRCFAKDICYQKRPFPLMYSIQSIRGSAFTEFVYFLGEKYLAQFTQSTSSN